MKIRKKYFMLNKPADFCNGRWEGIEIDEKGLHLRDNVNYGIYYSDVFDSQEKQTVWHRMVLMGSFEAGSNVHMTMYASDDRQIQIGGDWMDVGAALKDEKFALPYLGEWMEPYRQADLVSPEDELLHQIKGRYLWFKLELEGRHAQQPEIWGIKLAFPKDTWLKYLPEIYEENVEGASFLERYLGIFQSMYEEMTARIEDIPALLNPMTTGQEHLGWLAEWLVLENRAIWNEKQLRYLIANVIPLYQSRGTVCFMKELMRLYTGREAYVIERSQLEAFFGDSRMKQELERLYTNNPYKFTVLLDTRDIESSNLDNILRRIADMATPAGMECQIAIMKPYIFLGQYSYLGMNSVLGQYKPVELNGMSAMPFATIADR